MNDGIKGKWLKVSLLKTCEGVRWKYPQFNGNKSKFIPIRSN
jgi:hypothetical protein